MSIWDDASGALTEFDQWAPESGSPSESSLEDKLAQGASVFSTVWGVVVSTAGGIATLASGQQVPVSSLGPVTADNDPIPPDPEEWIEGVPNVAVLGLGALFAVILVKYL
jgi:hypothetical protein